MIQCEHFVPYSGYTTVLVRGSVRIPFVTVKVRHVVCPVKVIIFQTVDVLAVIPVVIGSFYQLFNPSG